LELSEKLFSFITFIRMEARGSQYWQRRRKCMSRGFDNIGLDFLASSHGRVRHCHYTHKIESWITKKILEKRNPNRRWREKNDTRSYRIICRRGRRSTASDPRKSSLSASPKPKSTQSANRISTTMRMMSTNSSTQKTWKQTFVWRKSHLIHTYQKHT
jgi:hypothetical protein